MTCKWLIITLVFLFSLKTYGRLSEDNPDSLRTVLETAVEDTLQLNLLYRLSQAYEYVDLDSAKSYAKRYLSLARLLGKSSDVANGHNLLGILLSREGKLAEGFRHYQESLRLYDSLEDESGALLIINNMAIIKTTEGDYERAIEYYSSLIGRARELEDSSHLSVGYNNLGYYLKEIGEYKKALKILFQALYLEKAQGNEWESIYPLYNIGSCYERLDVLDSACFYLDSALTQSQRLNDKYIESLSLHDLGYSNWKLGKKTEAIELLERAFAVADTNQLAKEKESSARTLSEFYIQLGNPSLAFHYLKIAEVVGDSLYNEQTARRIAQMESELELEQKLKEERARNKIELMKREMQVAETQLILAIFGFAVVILALVAILAYRDATIKKKANQQLRTLNVRISEQKEELLQQSEELNTLNEALYKLNNNLEESVKERTAELEEKNASLAEYAFFNAHKLRAPVATILGLISLIENEKVTHEERMELIASLRDSTKDLDDVTRQIQRILEKEELVSVPSNS
jgi:tetratricopeptide (TPR) repeat protein